MRSICDNLLYLKGSSELPQKRWHHSQNNRKWLKQSQSHFHQQFLTKATNFRCFDVFFVRPPQIFHVQTKISTIGPMFPDYGPEDIPACSCFRKHGHDFIKHAKFTLIEQLINDAHRSNDTLRLSLKRCQDFWILKLDTPAPKGLGQELKRKRKKFSKSY